MIGSGAGKAKVSDAETHDMRDLTSLTTTSPIAPTRDRGNFPDPRPTKVTKATDLSPRTILPKSRQETAEEFKSGDVALSPSEEADFRTVATEVYDEIRFFHGTSKEAKKSIILYGWSKGLKPNKLEKLLKELLIINDPNMNESEKLEAYFEISPKIVGLKNCKDLSSEERARLMEKETAAATKMFHARKNPELQEEMKKTTAYEARHFFAKNKECARSAIWQQGVRARSEYREFEGAIVRALMTEEERRSLEVDLNVGPNDIAFSTENDIPETSAGSKNAQVSQKGGLLAFQEGLRKRGRFASDLVASEFLEKVQSDSENDDI